MQRCICLLVDRLIQVSFRSAIVEDKCGAQLSRTI